MLWKLLVCFALLSQALSAPLKDLRRKALVKVLLISFDGFRWDYDQDVDTPNLDAMAREGVKAKYATPPYITITSPSHFTLLTGKYVENHGVIHNMWFNTTTGQKLPYYPTQFVNDWWDSGSLPIWVTAQRQGLKAGSVHFPGTAATYQGEKVGISEVEPRFYDYSNETVWREKIDMVMDWFTQQDLDFVTLYFGEPDLAGHKHGPDSQKRRDMVSQVDRTVGYLRSQAQQHGLENRLNLIITADHGMSTVLRKPAVKEIVLSQIPGFSFQDIKFQLVDYGPNGYLLPKDGQLEKVYNALKNGHPNLHVYKKEELPARLRYANNPRILPIVMFADPGYVINGYFTVQNNKGEHGFDNEAMDMKTIFRAIGPDFKKNLTVDPIETVEVYALMCELLGIKSEPNDGSIERTRHMLNTQGNKESETYPLESQVFIGLVSMACFLFLTGVVFIVHTARRRRKESKRSKEEIHDGREAKEAATSF
ncbi:ectonucleotide pyrophosphatase/phosphodiesterase family member 7-like [Acipenser oxyrinchus oxyrinchus]|uniref:Ectonucleotide pyrophosphatase/phosphodiesterase family member 7-like n=1 Tax=Acipenser oxyrinchus oxyrinchus TaxID=40147 RepID=A0AAD8D4F4_ACIOX|nr:ectonucleotide pyrophosphatase/phosphodiesterase family member 7-like [Acipenser oxyrinchus oxyrinchus]